jgi:hypothetical protein
MSRALRAASRARAAVDDLRGDDARVRRPLFQKLAQLLGDDLLDHRPDLGGDELFLGLRRELRLGHLHRQHAGEAFAHVVAGGLDLGLLRHVRFLDVLVEHPSHRRAQPGEVRAAVLLRDVVGEAEHAFLVGVVPLHRHLDGDAVLEARAVEDVRVQDVLGPVHVLDEALHAACEGEVLLLGDALVEQHDLHAVVEEGELPQPPRQDVVVEVDVAEDLLRGEEVHFRATPLGGADLLQRLDRHALAEFHLVRAALAPDGEPQPLGERIDHRDADAVQAARDLVGVGVELAAGVQLGHDDLGSGALQLVVVLDAGGNAATVVEHRDGVVGMDGDEDFVAEAGERLVDRVVDHLEHHVVQAGTVRGVADVHPRALAHRVQALQDLDRVRAVVAAAVALAVRHRFA